MARFQIKPLEHEAVIFDTASGDTHYLAPLSLAILQIVEKNPGLNPSEIEAALASNLSISASPNLTQLTEEALANLRRIGLMESP